MTAWPLDSLIVVGGLALGLALLCGHNLIMPKNPRALREGDFFRLHPGLKGYMICAGIMIMIACITYAATRAAADQAGMAALVVGGMALAGAIVIYFMLLVSVKFNLTTLESFTPFGGRKIYRWTDFYDLQYSSLRHQNYLVFIENGDFKKVYIPEFYGNAQLTARALLAMKPVNETPVTGKYIEPIAHSLIGKRLIIGVTQLGKDFYPVAGIEHYGIITGVENDWFIVELEGGDTGKKIRLPANLNNYQPAEYQSYVLSSSGDQVENVSVESLWYTEKQGFCLLSA